MIVKVERGGGRPRHVFIRFSTNYRSWWPKCQLGSSRGQNNFHKVSSSQSSILGSFDGQGLVGEKTTLLSEINVLSDRFPIRSSHSTWIPVTRIKKRLDTRARHFQGAKKMLKWMMINYRGRVNNVIHSFFKIVIFIFWHYFKFDHCDKNALEEIVKKKHSV